MKPRIPTTISIPISIPKHTTTLHYYTRSCSQLPRLLNQRSHYTPFHAYSTTTKPITQPKMTSTDQQSFENLFEPLINDILATIPSHFPKEGKEWFIKNMRYNVPGGKMNRGMMVLTTLEVLAESHGGRSLSSEEVFKARVLGWCVEWLQAFFLVADDVMDNSKTRRGQLCWFRQPSTGLIAINDAMLLESCLFSLLKTHFKSEPYYTDLMELFHDIIFKTELGQLMDLITAPEDIVNLKNFSMEKYEWIVEYKTAYYSFYLPVALSLHMYGITSPKAFEEASRVLIPLGVYFQVQDDYLDCYGDPKHIGKIGTDIRDNKCSWLINMALKNANEKQRGLLEKHYGRKEDEDEKVVKKVFEELGLKEKFLKFEQESFQKVNALIEKTELVPKEVYNKFVQRIYKRDK